MNAAFEKKNPQCFDMALFFFAPIFQLISFFILGLTFLVKISDLNQSILIATLYNNKVVSVILGYLISILLSVIVMMIDKKKMTNVWKGVFTLSVFMLTWIPINILCMIKRDFIWEPIRHTRNIDINTIV